MYVESVFVSGSNRGIGLEFVKQFLELEKPPRHIFAACRTPDSAKELQDLKSKYAGKTSVHILQLEATDEEQIAKCVEETTRIVSSAGLTLLVNNAAVMGHTLFPNISAEEYLQHYKVNVLGPMLLTQSMLPLLQLSATRNGSGDELKVERSAILNVGGRIATFEAVNLRIIFNVDAYRITKAAFHLGSAIEARELRPDNILVLTIHPGWVSTDLGGPKAPLTVQESVKNMMGVLKVAGPQQHGFLLNYDGQQIPW